MYVTLIIIVIIFSFLLATSYYFFALAIKRGNKEKILNQPHNKTTYQPNEKRMEKEKLWYQKNNEEVWLVSQDNLKLFGVKIKNSLSKDWIILVHGFSSTHLSVRHQAYEFYQMNFNVLLIDLRAHGKSEGKYIGMGVLDSIDLQDWIEYLNQTEQPDNIGLFGISMGATTVMMTIGNTLPKNVTFAIEDCGYTSVEKIFQYQLKMMFHLPSFPLLNMAESWTKTLAHYNFQEKTSISELKKTKIPVLFIHGEKDTFVPFKMLEENYESCVSKKEKLIIHDAGHGACESKSPTLYWTKIKKFMSKYKKMKKVGSKNVRRNKIL